MCINDARLNKYQINIRVIRSTRITRTGNVARMRTSISTYEELAGKREGKRQLRRTRLRRGDNIKMDLKQIGEERMERMSCLGWGRMVGKCEGGNKL